MSSELPEPPAHSFSGRWKMCSFNTREKAKTERNMGVRESNSERKELLAGWRMGSEDDI